MLLFLFTSFRLKVTHVPIFSALPWGPRDIASGLGTYLLSLYSRLSVYKDYTCKFEDPYSCFACQGRRSRRPAFGAP